MSFKVAVAALACVLVTLAAAQQTVTVTKYADTFYCHGNGQNFTLKTGTCDSGDAQRNISGIQLTCPSANASQLCANVTVDMRSNNCSDRFAQHFNVPCGQCVFDPMAQGFQTTSCDPVGKTVTFHRQCVRGCSSCNVSTTVAVGTCTRFQERNYTHSLMFNGLTSCPPFITEQVWYGAGSSCSGDEHTYQLEEGRCYDGYTFSCGSGSAPARRGTFGALRAHATLKHALHQAHARPNRF